MTFYKDRKCFEYLQGMTQDSSGYSSSVLNHCKDLQTHFQLPLASCSTWHDTNTDKQLSCSLGNNKEYTGSTYYSE